MTDLPRQYVIVTRRKDGSVGYYVGVKPGTCGHWTGSIWAAEQFPHRSGAYALAAQIRNCWRLPAKVETRTEMVR